MYKQYVRKTPKLLHMYIKHMPHPRSSDGTSLPLEELLQEFGFSEVNTALANALTTISNTVGAATSSAATYGVTIE